MREDIYNKVIHFGYQKISRRNPQTFAYFLKNLKTSENRCEWEKLVGEVTVRLSPSTAEKVLGALKFDDIWLG